MVNDALTGLVDDPETQLALSYAPADRRAALTALLALDRTLGNVVRTTSQAMVGQLRLAWWREALAALDAGRVPAEPVLVALAAHALPAGVSGTALAETIDGWEELLVNDPPDPATLGRYALARGRLFELAGVALGAAGDPLAAAGPGWALADLSRHLRDPASAAAAHAAALPLLTEATARRWSRAGRPLGALTHLALLDLTRPAPPGSPVRVWRMLRHRLTGR
jgi:15-cis-phytoene synthase